MKLLRPSIKLIYILLLVIVFFGSFLLGVKIRAQELGIKLYDIGNASQLPILNGEKTFPILSGQGVIAIDGDSNVTLYEKNADKEFLPASTTKIITALVSLDYYKLQDELTVTDPTIDGQRMGLMVGEKMTFENMLNGLLIYSANDAAITLADNYPGGREAFVNAMNTKVEQLHLDHSHFVNPAGLDDPNQFTTARDMVRVAIVAMQNPTFAKIVGTKNKIVTDVTGKFSYNVTNVNQLLGNVDGVMGIKTGWTEAARENLVTYVMRNNHKVFITILGSEDRFGETTELVNWIYGSYVWQKVTYTQKAVGMILK
jgi:D-alanyl-D-alanine carboxypeptidase (penicillin-binding protein 5/6)